MSLRKATILSVFFLTALCIFPTELKAKNVKKSFINDIHYTGINFKIDSKHTNIELIKGKFILNNTVHDEFSYQINSSKFLNKIKRLHRKSYKDLRKQAKKFNKNKNYSPQLENWYRIDVTKEMTPQDIIDIYNSLLDIDIISIVELETPPISAGFENCPALNCEPDLPPGGGDSSGDTPSYKATKHTLAKVL
ncbi:hypothetical protein [Shewanella woodyi]|uniref:hypothetical protein n=1 Tax=Shewanella woodyi TaxID=60961 RepID=UPI00374832CC